MQNAALSKSVALQLSFRGPVRMLLPAMAVLLGGGGGLR